MRRPDVRPDASEPGPVLRWPLVSVAVVVLLLAAHLLLDGAGTPRALERWGLGRSAGPLHDLAGTFTSFAPHTGVAHLLLNAAYLLSVGVFVEPLVGAARCAVVLVVAQLGGAMFVLAFAAPGYVEVGASNAIHGLLACGYAHGLLSFRSAGARWLCAGGLLYFGYMCVHAIATGRMPWPVAFFENGGHGHLGGIVAGAALGGLFARMRPAIPAAAYQA